MGSRAGGGGTPEGVLLPEGNRAWRGLRVAEPGAAVQAAVVTGRRGWCRGRHPGACGGGPRVSSGALRPAFVGGRRRGDAGAAPSRPSRPTWPPVSVGASAGARDGKSPVPAPGEPSAAQGGRARPCPVSRPPRGRGLPARPGQRRPAGCLLSPRSGEELKEKLARW